MRQLQIFNKIIPYRYIVAAIYACVLFLDRLDLTIVNIALPTLAKHFGVSVTQTEWIANGFLLALAISIPVSSWLGDRFGCKKIFIIATAIFGLSSLLCAYSPNIESMVLLRFLQGIGGGIIIPVGMTMVYRVFDYSEYASITSFIFLPTLIAPALAPSLGGLLIQLASWQWIFLFAVPICFVAIIVAMIVLDEIKVENSQKLDWGGFLLSSLSLILILYFISQLGKEELNFYTLILLVISALFVFSFYQYEKNHKAPLINISYFKQKLFLQTNLIQVAFQICHFGSMFLLAIYLQVGLGMTAMVSGFILGMQALGAMCTSRLSVRLFQNYGAGLPIVIGFIGVAIFTSCILIIKQPSMIYLGASILFIRGIFSGLCGTPIQTASVIGFDKAHVGRASAIFNAGRQVSITLGVALSTLFISYGFKSHGLSLVGQVNYIGPDAFYYAFAMIPVVALIGILITLGIDNQGIILKSKTLGKNNEDR